jgi:hypothetical protein
MRIQSAMLCEAATVENGKLFILGAGLASWTVPTFPAMASPVLVGVIEADPDIDQGQASFTISVVDRAGSALLTAEVAVNIQGDKTSEVPWIIPMIAPMQIPVAAPTPLDVLISSEAGIDVRIPLVVLLRNPAPDPGVS